MWKIYAGVAVVFISIATWIYVDMNSDIKSLEEENASLKNAKLTLELDLKTERENVTLLEKTVRDLTRDISTLTKSKEYFKNKYNALKSQNSLEAIKNEAVKQYMSSDVWKSEKCETGQEINKWVSELKYEDL